LRIQPKYDQEESRITEIKVNYDYLGQMICELHIKIGDGKPALLSESNNFLCQIEKICSRKDKKMLFEAYNK